MRLGLLKFLRPNLWRTIACVVLLLVIGVSLAYCVFIAIAMAFGLDADDRLITNAAWSKLRGAFGNAEGKA